MRILHELLTALPLYIHDHEGYAALSAPSAFVTATAESRRDNRQPQGIRMDQFRHDPKSSNCSTRPQASPKRGAMRVPRRSCAIFWKGFSPPSPGMT